MQKKNKKKKTIKTDAWIRVTRVWAKEWERLKKRHTKALSAIAVFVGVLKEAEGVRQNTHNLFSQRRWIPWSHMGPQKHAGQFETTRGHKESKLRKKRQKKNVLPVQWCLGLFFQLVSCAPHAWLCGMNQSYWEKTNSFVHWVLCLKTQPLMRCHWEACGLRQLGV